MNTFQILPVFNNKKNFHAICFAIDNAYIPYLAVTLHSLIKNSNNTEYYDIVVFSKKISFSNKADLNSLLTSNFSLRFYEGDDLADKLIGKNFRGNRLDWDVVYYRLLIPLLMGSYERVLYLDCDLIINQNISTLFHISFDRNLILAVKDHFCGLEDDAIEKKYIRDKLNSVDPNNYFNAGVLMFNTNQIDPARYIQQVRSLIFKDGLRYKDQDILNTIFTKQKKLIDLKFNMQVGIFDREIIYLDVAQKDITRELRNALKNPVIIHFTGSKKPWKDLPCVGQTIFFKYADETDLYIKNEIKLRGKKFQENRTTTLLKNGTRLIDQTISKYKKRLFLHRLASFFSNKHKNKVIAYHAKIEKLKRLAKNPLNYQSAIEQ